MVKPQPNHKIYIEILKSMTPEQRLRKTFELTAFGRDLFRAGLRRRHPELAPAEFETLVRDQFVRCHNQPY
jgi:hypothetical protein